MRKKPDDSFSESHFSPLETPSKFKMFTIVEETRCSSELNTNTYGVVTPNPTRDYRPEPYSGLSPQTPLGAVAPNPTRGCRPKPHSGLSPQTPLGTIVPNPYSGLSPRSPLPPTRLADRLDVAVGMVWPAEQFRSAMYLVAWVHISVTAVGTT
jgi:hypothetical protein